MVGFLLLFNSCHDKKNNFKNFNGIISERYQISGSLIIENDLISGYYYYDKYKIPLDISGFCKGDSLFFSGLNKQGKIIDKFTGVFEKNKIHGIWIKGSGSKKSAFEITQYGTPKTNYSIGLIILFLVLIPILLLFKKNKKDIFEDISYTTTPSSVSNTTFSNQSNRNVIVEVESNKSTPLRKSENSNEKKGNDFENYIVDLFGIKKGYFTLMEWRPDKISNKSNIYAKSNFFPDLHYEIKNNNIAYQFAVECKYRSRTASIIKIAIDRQLENYRNFSNDKKCPVFIILGLGGSPQNPNELFIIPLNRAKEEMPYDQLKTEFIKKNRNFFYDLKTEILI